MKIAISILLLACGCCYVKCGPGTVSVIDVGTGRRTVRVATNGVTVTHSELAETLQATGVLVGTAVKTAVKP